MDRVRRGFRVTYYIQLVWALFCILIAYSFAPLFASILTASEDSVIIGWSVKYFRTCVLFYPVVAIVYIFRNSLQALNRRIIPVLSSFIELIGKLLSALIIVPAVGYEAVIFTEPLIWSAMALFLAVSYSILLKCDAFKKESNNVPGCL